MKATSTVTASTTDREPFAAAARMDDRVQATDEQLVEAVMRGDSSAIKLLVERHHARLLAFLYRMLAGDHHLAEDLVQETFLRILRQRSYVPRRPFKPWMYAIAGNLARDHFRSRSPDPDDAAVLEIVDPAPGPETAALASDTKRVVMKALARLPHEYRAAMMLRFFEDLSLNEIAVTLDVPVGTVKSRLSVGGRKLRELLADLSEADR